MEGLLCSQVYSFSSCLLLWQTFSFLLSLDIWCSHPVVASGWFSECGRSQGNAMLLLKDGGV